MLCLFKEFWLNFIGGKDMNEDGGFIERREIFVEDWWELEKLVVVGVLIIYWIRDCEK